jgi:hypothetical protein
VADIDFLDMRRLVSALETSAQGSSVLDLELKCSFESEISAVNAGSVSGLGAEFAPETIEIILGEMLTPFTRSLDSALPGENIVFSMYATTKKLWVSVHRDPEGREFVSWAATEPLSRRAAALRGFARISAEGTGAEPVSMLRPEVGLPPEPDDPAKRHDIQAPQVDADTAHPDWRVRF